MENHEKKPKLNASDDNLTETTQKVDLVESSFEAAQSTITTKITDLNDHCLEKIFMHLDVECLFNVANANKWLRPSAAMVYGQKFGKNPVNLCSIRGCSPSLYMFDKYICLDSLKLSLAFLRCFGEKIPELILFCRRAFASANSEYIDRYMNQYCADTLTRICISGRSTFSNETFTKPFIKIQSVEFFGSNFQYSLQNFVNWFPNVKKLKIHASLMNHLMTNVHFLHLEHLSIPIENSSWNDISGLLHLHPQLNSLQMDMHENVDKTMDDLLDIISDNTLISKLILNVGSDTPVNVNAHEMQRLISEHRLIVELVLLRYLFSIEDVIFLIGQLNSLKKFHFRINGRSDYDYLVRRLDQQQWHHNFGYMSNLKTKKHYHFVELNKIEN